MRRASAAAVALVLTAALAAGCASARDPAANGRPLPEPTALAGSVSPAHPTVPSASRTASATAGVSVSPRPGQAEQISKVLAISVDGLNPGAITRLGPSKSPAFHRMMREGASTLNARTEVEETLTLPNHTGMLTGRRVSRKSGGHGVTFNDDEDATTVHKAAGEYVASAFDVVHDHAGSTALYCAKEKFAIFARTWNAAGAPDRVPPDDGRKKIDKVVIDTDNARLVRALSVELRTSPRTFTFLHVSLPDLAGHDHGFMGAEYLAAVQRTDALLGDVLDTVAAEPVLRDDLLVVLTADHGGAGSKSHDDPTKLADYRIPFLAWGAGVPAGRDLYAINPTFRDPGTTRPGYHGVQPIRNGDLANLVTSVLDLPPVPGSQLDRPPTLAVS